MGWTSSEGVRQTLRKGTHNDTLPGSSKPLKQSLRVRGGGGINQPHEGSHGYAMGGATL